jgi:AraC-like DNA-binding protein
MVFSQVRSNAGIKKKRGAVTHYKAAATHYKMLKHAKDNTLSDRVVEFVLTREVSEMAGLTVKNIARAFDVNPSYLSRRFVLDKKVPLGEHIMQMKIYRSALLLMMKDSKELSVNQLAKNLGFCTPSYFIHTFRKLFGIGPGKYRDCIKWKNSF